MKKLLLVFLVLISEMPGYSQTADTTHYCWSLKEYPINLVNNGVVLDYDTVYAYCHNYPIDIIIHNNSKSDILYLTSKYDDPVVVKGIASGTKIHQGQQFKITISLSKRVGKVHRLTYIMYRKVGSDENIYLPIRVIGTQLDKHLETKYHLKQRGETACIDPGDFGYVVPAPKEANKIYYTGFKDTISHALNAPSAYLDVNTVKYPPSINFKIENDSKTQIVVDSIVGSNEQMTFYVLNGCNWRHKTPMNKQVNSDDDLLVKGNVLYQKEPNLLQTDLMIYYREKLAIGDYSNTKVYRLPIRGIVDPTIKSVATKKTGGTYTGAKKSSPKSASKTSYIPSKIPTDYTRYKDAELIQTTKNQKNEVSLILDEPKYYPEYWMKVPKRMPYVIKWDTLSKEEVANTSMVIRMKNITDKEVYLRKIYGGNHHLRVKLLSNSIIYQDSSLVFEIVPSPKYKGDFHEGVGIECSNIYGKVFSWSLYNWGYANFNPNPTAPLPKVQDSILLYIQDTTKLTTHDYKLVGVLKGGEEFGFTKKTINSEKCYTIPRIKDTLYLSIIDKELGVVYKNLLYPEKMDDRAYIYISNHKSGPHTYRYGRQMPLELMDYSYFAKWDYDEGNFEEVYDYLKELDVKCSSTCSSRQLFIRFKSEEEAEQWRKKLLQSKYEIVLMPATRESSLNQQGWGGMCKWFSNEFTVGFKMGTSMKTIETIFKKIGIEDYEQLSSFGSYLRVREKNTLRFRFTLSNLVGKEFQEQLDELWEYPEVLYLDHRTGGTAGLD